MEVGYARDVKWAGYSVAVLAVGAGLAFGAQTAMGREDACNPLPPEYGGPTCTPSGCEACCQDNNQLPGTCWLWDACGCG